MDDFDYELLINLVQEREVLWDKTSESYKDKRKNVKAWQEICVILNEKFETLNDKEKNEYGKLLLNKWRNMRDSWMKYEKKIHENKSGAAAKTLHKYVYYDNMQFLKKTVNRRGTESSMTSPINNEPTAPKRPRIATTTNAMDARMLSFMDKMENEDESRSMAFFKSIAPTVDRFCDADIVEFQFQVMSILRNVQNRNRNTNSNYDYQYSTSNINAPTSHHAGQTSSYDFNTDVPPSTAYGYRTTATTGISFNRRPDTQTSNYSGTSSLNVLSPDGSSLDLDFAELN